MFQESEIINLLMAIISALIILFTFIRQDILHYKLFMSGFSFMLAALVFTVVEGVILKDFFNILEHLCYTISGFFFLLGVIQLNRKDRQIEEVS